MENESVLSETEKKALNRHPFWSCVFHPVWGCVFVVLAAIIGVLAIIVHNIGEGLKNMGK
jgi:hypothetical protein